MKFSAIKLSEQQRDIVLNTMGNIVVSASAGTGKTRTMTAKIIYDLEHNRTHKSIAAITFTIKAAQEIRDRLGNVSDNFVGTNNSFAIEEVIKPFMKDVYGNKYNVDIDTDYQDNTNKFNTLDEGIEKIRVFQTIYSYKYNKKNFVFDLALNIIKNSLACRLYLQSKYFSIYVDEYQDCDLDMHNFFMYISDILKITTFVVGDDKQSIYRWRGANPDSFKSIFRKAGFTHKELTENHRSDKQIQDFSNLLFEQTSKLVSNPKNNNNIIFIKSTNDDWASIVASLLDENKTSALLRSQKQNSKTQKQGASEGAELLTTAGLHHTFIPTTPIDDITTNSAWLYVSTASYVLLDHYSVYNFIGDIPSGVNEDKKIINKIHKFLNKIKENTINKNKASFKTSVKKLADYVGYAVTDECLRKLYDTVSDSRYAVSLDSEKPAHCSLTLHSSKGLEFEQVVLFAEDYAHFQKFYGEHLNNLYVACTRAMSKLIIIKTDHSDTTLVCKKIKGIFQTENLKIQNLITVHDSYKERS